MPGASATQLLSVLGSSRSNGLKRCKLNIFFYCFSQKIQNPDFFYINILSLCKDRWDCLVSDRCRSQGCFTCGCSF